MRPTNEQKEALRLAMPITAQLVDSHRLIFGELNAIKATENGHSIEWRKSANKLKRGEK